MSQRNIPIRPPPCTANLTTGSNKISRKTHGQPPDVPKNGRWDQPFWGPEGVDEGSSSTIMMVFPLGVPGVGTIGYFVIFGQKIS